ncbi:YqhG family protein [Alkalibacillus almallahensis]|uniref:YqhG family protein n=1 Tax=Alkalibacillus almallahensis TaxID=1379154 RepID=UPI001420712B|nr:YqhG family protein [Alkalibacillus almallahensis]NIK12435.1 hypothetical protein [Alkalibacillus almallahensis]
MKQTDLKPFVKQFFTKHHAQIKDEREDLLTIQLTKALDQQLMNRPFYWQYVNTMGFEGDPMTVSFAFSDQYDLHTERIHLGSPRLHQIFQIVKNEGVFATLFEQTESTDNRLDPWFVFNGYIQYQGAWLEEESVSIGILLTNGTMRFSWMDAVMDIPFNPVIPTYQFKLPIIISLEHGLEKIINELQSRIEKQSREFVKESLSLYEQELSLLNTLSHEQDEESKQFYNHSHDQIYNRLYPRIDINLINAGLFYTNRQTTQRLIDA